MMRELGSDRDIAARAAAAADSLRRWEEEAYRTFAELVAGQDGITGSTDSEGQAHLELEAGRWWRGAPTPKTPSWSSPGTYHWW